MCIALITSINKGKIRTRYRNSSAVRIRTRSFSKFIYPGIKVIHVRKTILCKKLVRFIKNL